MGTEIFAFSLTLFAGMATGIGSLCALFAKKNNMKFLSISLGFSAGVMIYVSMIEIFEKAKIALTQVYGVKSGAWITVLAFFCGMIFIALIDRCIPERENPHEIPNTEEGKQENGFMRMGIFTALAIGIHNFPEGLATFISGLQEVSIAIPIAVAIAIHNIPEGIAVSVPIYFATGNRKKAFQYSFVSGLTEPLGALIGYTLLRPFMNDAVFGIIFAMVAGIMVFISLDELLPSALMEARTCGEHHFCIYGLVAGMALMAVSLLLFL